MSEYAYRARGPQTLMERRLAGRVRELEAHVARLLDQLARYPVVGIPKGVEELGPPARMDPEAGTLRLAAAQAEVAAFEAAHPDWDGRRQRRRRAEARQAEEVAAA